MTVRKKDNVLRGARTPAYVDRVTGAAELQISPDTWDQWVKEGHIPPPCEAIPAGTPRWRWEDVDRKLSGQMASDIDAYMRGAAFFGRKSTAADAAVRGALNFGKKRGSATSRRRAGLLELVMTARKVDNLLMDSGACTLPPREAK